ncbi:MAG TPA: hypothetical protein PK619_00765 [bacterium]|nr:hypothetical protein [bacterium]HOH67267.1 hypothetical protein [bacterium]HPN81704.1 hypothetical protein [bacterium]HPW39242.1 hypothetical protein [bacterium]
MLVSSVSVLGFREPFYAYWQPMTQALVLAHQNEALGLKISALGVVMEISAEACRLARLKAQTRCGRGFYIL